MNLGKYHRVILEECNPLEIRKRIEKYLNGVNNKEKAIQYLRELTQAFINYIENYKGDGSNFLGFSQYERPMIPAYYLRKMEEADIVQKTYWSNRWHHMIVKCPFEILELLDELYAEQKNGKEIISTEEVYYDTNEIYIPPDLFDVIVGYDDIKELLIDILRSPKQIHVLFIGPPGSAKTTFLVCLERIEAPKLRLDAMSLTKAGLAELIKEAKPYLLLIDELDKVDRVKDLAVLLSLMEEGAIRKSTKFEKWVLKINTKVFGACNILRDFERQLPGLLSRFHYKLHFKPYTRQEFIEVATRVLTVMEGLDEDLAKYIAIKLAPYTRDVREAIGVARTVITEPTQEKVDRIIQIKVKYMKTPYKTYAYY